MARGNDSRDVDLAFGQKRLRAAHAYLEQARLTARDAGDEFERATAVSSAVLAAIAAADSICALRMRTAWKGDHAQAHNLLRQVAGGREAATALQRVVGHKTAVQYLAQAVTAARMETALRQAQVVMDFADQLYREG